jgi:T-complex protein 1 subunit theta
LQEERGRILIVSFFMADMSVHTVEDIRDVDKLTLAIKSVVASKQFGYEDLIAPLIARACVQILPKNPKQVGLISVRISLW